MGDSSAALRTCPDCGGILESTRPGWLPAIELVPFTSAEPIDDAEEWRCLICGYQDAPARQAEV